MQIAIGSARGLSYLHNQIQPPIIHRDIKVSGRDAHREANTLRGYSQLSISGVTLRCHCWVRELQPPVARIDRDLNARVRACSVVVCLCLARPVYAHCSPQTS